MALYDHIQELRAELSASYDPAETAQIKRELAAAWAEFERLSAAQPWEIAGETRIG